MSYFKKILIVLALSAGTVVLDVFVMSGIIKNTGLSIVGRTSGFFAAKIMPSSNFLRVLFNVSDIADENKKLSEQNQKLLSEAGRLESLQRENDFLRDQVGVIRNKEPDLILGQITSIDRTALSSFITVNRGSANGIQEKVAVVSAGNILVGTVVSVFKDYSLVRLVDDPGSSLSVRVISAPDTDSGRGETFLASAKGILGGKLSLDLIKNDDDVIEGDLVLTSGIDGLPEGLPIARVIEVKKSDAGSFSEVKADMIFHAPSTPNLFIIKND
ncbi:MAG: rod shape-determining protein MreC [bacterium]|nr:rod shape-determining protein MreC [bacterium]